MKGEWEGRFDHNSENIDRNHAASVSTKAENHFFSSNTHSTRTYGIPKTGIETLLASVRLFLHSNFILQALPTCLLLLLDLTTYVLFSRVFKTT